MSTEFELIQQIQARVPSSPSVRVGIGDDGCVLSPSQGCDLVMSTDTIVLDRHFSADWLASEVGYLAMAVNLSDLAAMGARPRWALLSLIMPKKTSYATPAWLNSFMDGFLSHPSGPSLVGGNMSEGPLAITVQVIGEVKRGQAITRDGSAVDDYLLVTGTLGDAAAALREQASKHPFLIERLKRPSARVSFGQKIGPWVHGLIDISDGLISDLTHLLDPTAGAFTSGHPLGATIELPKLPASDALLECINEPQLRWPLQLSGGSDYELLMSAPEASLEYLHEIAGQEGVDLSVIGRINDSGEVMCLDGGGQAFIHQGRGWDHFASEQRS